MATKKTFYITTPIYYPNDKPHIGHAYTTLAGDILARWHMLLGKEVFFLTGTDEHGKKIQRAAEKARKRPQTFVDHLIPEFKEAWKALNIKYSRFIRTTDKDHEQVVQVLLSEIHKKGDIYEGYYEGFYCTACEAYYTEKELVENCCPIHKTKIEKLKEASYFFRLSQYQKKLLDWYKKNPEFIQPAARKQEIINRVKEGLQDLSISRTSFDWGIPLPFDKSHVCYVWFDALANYLSGIGYLENNTQFKKYWPADVHLVGKDILWFHAVIWPAMLLSLDIEPPKQVFAHGWWTLDKEKISKSKGALISIPELIQIAGVDAARYFLFRAIPFGEDGDFSERALVERHNNELADKLGNLVSRVSALAEQHGLAKTKLLDSSSVIKRVSTHFEKLELDKALNELFTFIDLLNEYTQHKKPWESKDTKVLYQLCNGIKDATILLSPFIPETAEKIAHVFHFELTWKALQTPVAITKVKKAPILFQKRAMVKKDTKKEGKMTNNADASTASVNKRVAMNASEKISYDVFSKLDLRVGKILKVKEHSNADKLYVLEVDLGNGDKRTLVAGLKNHYEKKHLEGKKAIFVANLAPATIRGIESDGMILAAVNEDDSHVTILIPDEDIAVGSKVR